MSVTEDSTQQRKSDDATIGFDAEGRVLSVSESAATALGYSQPEDLKGVPLAALIGDEAAITLLDRAVFADELDLPDGEAGDEIFAGGAGSSVTFVRHDGSRISLNTVLTPETSGGWITLLDPASGGTANAESLSGFTAPVDVAAVLRRLTEQSGSIGDVAEIASRFASELVTATGAESVTVAKSSAISGIYEPLARVSQTSASSLTETIDLPPALVPQQGSGPIAVDSLETLALFEPVIIYGEEFDGAYIAARADLYDGAHLLVIATAPSGKVWADTATLALEAGVLTLAGTLRAAELDRRIASYSRASETVRQIGALASRDHDGKFLDAARKIIARRLPVSAISIHVANTENGRCYVPEASSTGEEEYGALAPGVEWSLAGSIEQRVLKTGAAVFTSATSSERLSVPSATIAHWRASGLQGVAAIPLREAGEVVAIMLAGFSSPVSDPKEVIRLLESIAPAVHLGVGLSAGKADAPAEPEDSSADPGFVSPAVLLAITKAAADSPDTRMLFASVTEWMPEIITSSRIAWGTIDRAENIYHRLYDYDSTSGNSNGEAKTQLDSEAMGDLSGAGLGLGEPGHLQAPGGPMRAPIMVSHRLLGVVTVWPREEEAFGTGDLARLERVCKFVSGPLDRILETEAVRDSQRKLELTTEVGTLAAEFFEPSQALRVLRSNICDLFPHDRALFVEFDQFEGNVAVRFDSAALPDDSKSETVPMSGLPSQDLPTTGEPVSLSISPDDRELHPIFAGFESLLAIPIKAGEGPDSALLLMSEKRRPVTGDQIRLATAFSGQMKGALARWQAHASTRELRRNVIDIRKQLSLVLDCAPVMLISADVDGICYALEGHGLETLGILREDLHNRSIFEFASKWPQLEDAIKQAMSGVMATALTSLDTRSFEIWVQPATETDGSVKGITLVGYDVSDRVRRKQANAEKRDLDATLKERSAIIESASHELRNHLQSIVAYADIMAVGAESQLNQSQAHALSVILRTAEQLDTMIGDLPALSLKIGLSAVDVSSLMNEIVDTKVPMFTTAGQALSLTLPETLYTVQADQLRLTQVVTNLLSNACKYSPRGASVSVDVSVVEEILNVSVSDTGPGIPADQLERVWDTGIRLASSGSDAVKGSGLGLAIARKIVEMHGGTASIESEVGFGTTVTVRLPGATLMDEADEGDTEDEGKAQGKRSGISHPRASRTKATKSAAARPKRRRRTA